MFNYIFFDLDGTLTDSAPGIINSIKYACDKMKLAYPDEETLKSFVGPPLKGMMQKVFSLSDKAADKMVALYRERFSAVGLFENSVYPGVYDMLSDIKAAGLKTALATSKPTVFAERILDKFELSKYFDFISGSELSGAHVSKTEVISIAMENLKASKSESIMVGDRSFDILSSHELGIASLAVTYGYASPGEIELCRPDYTRSSPHEISEFILNIDKCKYINK